VRVPISWVPFSLAHMYRSTSGDAPPVEVRDLGNGYWRVLDGRHRYLASVIAGRPDLLATVEAATPSTPPKEP
jgi:uncharacterized ParB-like nuclease family protein